MEANYTIAVLSENSPGVLQRITVLFTRRKINIESLTVSETERTGVSRFTIVLKVASDLVYKVARQLERIVEVLEVHVYLDSELVHRELALYHVLVRDADALSQLREVVAYNGGKLLNEGAGSVTVELSGTETQVSAMLSRLSPFGVQQFVRSGRIALATLQ